MTAEMHMYMILVATLIFTTSRIFLENSSTEVTKTALLVSGNTFKAVRTLTGVCMLHGRELLRISILFHTSENIYICCTFLWLMKRIIN